MQDLRFVWLELTGRCPLLCDHCYAGSGPKGTDGAMLPEDWLRVINEVAQLGGRMVQFIGGEPTLHRSLPVFVDHALAGGLEVEVFSNLVHVSPQLWEVFAQPGVRLATSYYSDRATGTRRSPRAGTATPGPRPISSKPCAGRSRCAWGSSTSRMDSEWSRLVQSWNPSE
jgi:hypothetical protein